MYSTTPIIDVASIYPYTLRIFRDLYGGKILKRRRVSGKTWYQWRVYGDRALHLIDEVHPHLHEKKAQALLVLEIRRTHPGPQRQGLIAQLKTFKKMEYPDGTEA